MYIMDVQKMENIMTTGLKIISRLDWVFNTEWKTIRGYPTYMVSSFGEVLNTTTQRLLKPNTDNRGYLRVSLSGKTCRIHRLVASSFLDNTENKPSVDHINNDKLDNRLVNLRWATAQENGRNCGLTKNNTSGIKGVSLESAKMLWKVIIRNESGKKLHVGYFKNKEDAIEARKLRANEIYGEFTNACEKIFER